MINELINIEQIKAIDVFTLEGIEPVLEKIHNEVRSFDADISTDKGRKAVASLANKVARSKTLLDDLGKNLVSEWKSKSKVVDSSRKKLRDSLDLLKSEARKPLTDWEKLESDRVASIKFQLRQIKDLFTELDYYDSKELSHRMNTVKLITIDDTFGEFKEEAVNLVTEGTRVLDFCLKKTVKQENETAELERLRAEEKERKKFEYEENIRKEARENERKASIVREKKAIRDKELAIDKAKKFKEQAKQNELLAVQREREKIKKEEEKKQAKLLKQQQNSKHRAKIHNKIIISLKDHTYISDDSVKELIMAVADGKIEHLSINY